MTNPDTTPTEPEVKFDRHRCAAELRLATKDDKDFPLFMEQDTFVAVGRTDGAANVLATEHGWQVQDLTDSKIQVEEFDTAEDAVKAGKAVRT